MVSGGILGPELNPSGGARVDFEDRQQIVLGWREGQVQGSAHRGRVIGQNV